MSELFLEENLSLKYTEDSFISQGDRVCEINGIVMKSCKCTNYVWVKKMTLLMVFRSFSLF